jgi:tetratricopeptide (TPR) repeat protein
VPEARRRWPASSAPEVPVSADPLEDDSPSVVQQAYRLAERGEANRALYLLGSDDVDDPLSPHVQVSRGLALKQTGRLREAVAAFRAARFLDWHAWFAPYELGLCLEALGDTEDASEAYRHAVAVLEQGGPSGIAELSDAVEALGLSVADACRLRLGILARRVE